MQLFFNFVQKNKSIDKMRKIFSLLLCVLMVIPAMPKDFDHPWKGRKVAYLGDSITDPKNSGSKKKYWGFLEELLGITPYVYGKSGRQWDDIPRQTRQLQQEHGDDVDAIMIFMGTNDYNNAVPIGKWFDETEDSVVAARNKQWPKKTYLREKRTPNMNKATLRGRINIAISTLKKIYPKKQIVLLTPIHRAYFYGGENNIQPTEEYANAAGIFFDEYVKSVKEAGNIWAVPVIDVNAVSGLYPLFDEGAQYFHTSDTDRLHPNDIGHYRLAKTLYYQLLTIPCDFK